MRPEIMFGILGLLALIGGVSIAVINRRKERTERRQAWVKYFVYLAIVFSTTVFIILIPEYFPLFCAAIAVGGALEIAMLQIRCRNMKWAVFIVMMSAYLIAALLFVYFGAQREDILLFTFSVVICFDAFSQITGQLMGRRKLLPKISPNKTLEGLIGGAAIALSIGLLIGAGLKWDMLRSFLSGIVIVAFAFAGDVSASYVKRLYGVKDFSKVIPGHGGILDRFDSLIFAGAGIAIMLISGLQNV